LTAPVQRREYASVAKWSGISFFLVALLLAVLGVFVAGLFGFFIGLVFFPILLLGFPLACWRSILVIAPDRVFRHLILERPHEDLLRRFRIPLSGQSSYFLGSPGLPPSLVWRLLQTISVVFLLASIGTPALSPTRNAFAEESWFFSLALIALSFVMPIISLLWVYEDSGVRRYDKEAVTVSKLGTWVQRFTFGTGVVTWFVKFTLSVQGGTVEQTALATVLFTVLVPPCLVVTVVFHRNLQPMFVNRFLGSRSSRVLDRRNIELVPDTNSNDRTDPAEL